MGGKVCITASIELIISGVLRNMIDTIGDKTRTISFTDAVIESADNIRAFLSLVRGEVPRSLFKNSNRELFALVPFLQKYDCVTPLNNLSNFVLHLYIDRNDEDTMDEGYALAFGALTDNMALCCRVIDDPLPRYSSEEVNGPRIPYEALLHLPPTYVYALYHTYRRERDWREARSVFFQEELAYAKVSSAGQEISDSSLSMRPFRLGRDSDGPLRWFQIVEFPIHSVESAPRTIRL